MKVKLLAAIMATISSSAFALDYSVIPNTDDTIGIAFKKGDALAKPVSDCINQNKAKKVDMLNFKFNPQVRLPGAQEVAVYTDAQYPPFSYKNEKGDIVGYDISVLKSTEKCLYDKGHKVYFNAKVEGDFDNVMNIVKNRPGTRIGASGISITEERKPFYDFTPSYLTNKLVIVSKDGYKTVDALLTSGKTIVVQTGTTAQFFFEDINAGKKPEYAQYKGKVAFKTMKSSGAILAGYKAGAIRNFVTDLPVANSMK